MGWTDSRITLVAPGWTLVAEVENPDSQTTSGVPVSVLRAERADYSHARKVDVADVRRWFEACGFHVIQSRSPGTRLQWEDIEVLLGKEDNELAEVILTFSLSRESPTRWSLWRELVEGLSYAWDLRLFDIQRGFIVEANEFLRVLSGTQAWKDFEATFQWPAAQ